MYEAVNTLIILFWYRPAHADGASERGLFMSVDSLNPNRLSDRDVSTIVALSYRLSEKGVTGGGIPVEMDDGGRLVAVLDPKHQTIALAFGRNEDGYYVFDHEGRPIAEECQSIEKIIDLL